MRQQRGAEGLGLSSVVLARGGRSLIAPLSVVPDDATVPVMVDLHEGDNVLCAFSESDGARSPDSPLCHVRYTPGASRVATSQEQRFGTIVHSGTPAPHAPAAHAPHAPSAAPATAQPDPNWRPSSPAVYNPPSEPLRPEGDEEESGGGSRKVFIAVLLVLAGLAAAAVFALLKSR